MADLPALATVADLAAYTQEPIADGDPAASLALDIASGTIRSYLDTDFVPVATETVLLDPTPGAVVSLPDRPVTEVVSVEVYDRSTDTWSPAPTAAYTLSRAKGLIWALPFYGVDWPTFPESWRVTYSHGWDEVPSAVKGVAVAVAARIWATPVGIKSEHVGGYSVSFAGPEQGALTAIEQMALRRYRVVPIA